MTADDYPPVRWEVMCHAGLTVNYLTFKGKRQLSMNMLACLSSICVCLKLACRLSLKHLRLMRSWQSFHFLLLLLLLATVTQVMSAEEEEDLPSLLLPTCQNQRNVHPKTRGVVELSPAVICSYLRSRKRVFPLNVNQIKTFSVKIYLLP